MTFQTDVQADFDALLAAAEHSEDVTYTPNGGAPTLIKAFVTEGSLDEFRAKTLIGFTAEGSTEPSIFQVSKTDVPTVTPQKDTIVWNATTYYVKAKLPAHGDPAAWRLFCVK